MSAISSFFFHSVHIFKAKHKEAQVLDQPIPFALNNKEDENQPLIKVEKKAFSKYLHS